MDTIWVCLSGDHKCTQRSEGEGEGKYTSPPANFKTIVNKHAIKPEIGGDPPGNFS